MSWLKKKKSKPALFIFIITLGLVLFGLLMIYNASSFEAYQVFGDKFYYLRNQALWAILGLISLIFASLIPYENLKFISLPLLVFNSVLLIIVLIPGIGTKVLGARRWISLGNFSFQPSEFLKLTLSIYLSAWLEEKRPLWPFLVVTFFLLGLIVLQPDLGTGVVIVVTSFFVYFVSGAKPGKLFLLSLLGLVFGAVLIFSSQYRKNRILTFLNPSLDPLGQSYHLRQILIALGSGGMFGLGLGQSRQKYQYLPEATTDSIFAVIAEETGFLGASFLIFLFLFFIMLGLKISKGAKDRFGQLLSCSLITWIGVQAFINFGAMVSLLPLTGLPLPFISYGGSSLIVAMTSVGILINIAKPR